MTATNHIMTGAVIALVVKQPAIAIPVAFCSHFVLDMIPHFGIYEGDVLKRNQSRFFRTLLTTDILIMITLLVIIPNLSIKAAGWVVFVCMAAAILPDSIWVYRFIDEIKTQVWKPGGWFARTHQKIQWFEQPIGLVVEFIWLGLMSVAFFRLNT